MYFPIDDVSGQKDETRHIVCTQILKFMHHMPVDHTVVNVLSLPAQTFAFEHMLHNQAIPEHPGRQVVFTCVERNEAIYKQAKARLPDYCTLLYGELNRLCGHMAYDVVWADYCSAVSASGLDTAFMAVKNSVGPALVFTTHQANRHGGSLPLIKERLMGAGGDTLEACIHSYVMKRMPFHRCIRSLGHLRYVSGSKGNTAMLLSAWQVGSTSLLTRPLSSWYEGGRITRK